VVKVRDNWRLLLARVAQEAGIGAGAVIGNPLVTFPGTVPALL